MRPEQPRTGFALQRWQADSAPWGTLSTGLLQGLIHSARPPSFCFLLPRVHAADVAAAQPAQMPSSSSSSSSTSPAPAPISSLSTMPSNLGKPEFPDTGWDRIKDLFDRDVTQRYPEELTNVVKSGVVAALAGLIYGGLPAARHARQRYIQVSQAEIYSSRVEAVRSAHNAAIRGFVRYGWRWSWRVAAFVTLFNSVSTGLSVYRDKYTLSNYAAAGAVYWRPLQIEPGPRRPGGWVDHRSSAGDSHWRSDHQHAVSGRRNRPREEEERAQGTL
ncbi:complex I assembly factor TIMMDC1, mitochondrial isoform X1 [Seriola dumerili]|uniref:complex I assembly factor TIMMDC1, mitochondrial isoform X1 n=1 Tax=Seriola dumerili TaxID=41447 RepID=UPI000BBE3A92|nr:complex I assembly factor TIMMDC1, mitochondrial isoform X1 [Seriola dumerili]XP_022602276.1 complex I assembly factor TIMMDC1, mitochondrial isoform X1 [Seriola dumerili]